MKNTLGVDIGYGYTKVCGDKLSKAFPSQVTRFKTRGAFGGYSDTITVNGQPFVVGDEIDSLEDCSVSKDFVGTQEYLALMGRALLMAKYPCDLLVMGLPPGLYDEERIAKLEKLTTDAKIYDGNGEKIDMPGAIKIIPQGAGIYYDYIAGGQQRAAQAKTGNIVVIDIGHYTLDVVLFSSGRYMAGAARSFPLGISKLFNGIKTEFSKIYGEFQNNDDNILKLIREGSFTQFGRTYSVDTTPLMEDYINHKVIKAIRNYASDLRESTSISVDEIVIGGGGVNCIGQLMAQATIIEDPQMSNARGYFQYGKRQADALIGKNDTAVLRSAVCMS